MSSSDIFYGIADGAYWLFINTLEVIGDAAWMLVLAFGFVAFIYWMFRQHKYNQIAENDPNQIK